MVVQFPDNIRRPLRLEITGDGYIPVVSKKDTHAAEPIKDINDIVKIQEYLIGSERYRDNLLFTMGINVGLRCGDLRWLRVGDLLEVTDRGTAYRDEVYVKEEKTGKVRRFYTNSAVLDAADLYFSHCGQVSLNDLIFKSKSNNGKNGDKPLAVPSIEQLLKEIINDKCGLTVHASTHCLRKTFAYHMIVNAPDRNRAIEFLQKIFGHSSPSITLRYAGITDDEIRDAYHSLNLGSRNPFGFTLKEAIKKEAVC